MKTWLRTLAGLSALSVAAGAWGLAVVEWKSGIVWQTPNVVDPGPVGGIPSDARVLFDGTNLDSWNGGQNWLIADGAATAAKSAIVTKEAFGDCQLHLEWASPEKVTGTGQGRGNSGIHFMGRYEVQILDSYENTTYVDGQAASLYKTRPPLVNACRRPGEWQTFDILFEAPRFDRQGHLLRPAYMTVLHNGIVVHNHTEILGETSYVRPPAYLAHAERLPLSLQYHKNPVRFRNIWIRELKDLEATFPE